MDATRISFGPPNYLTLAAYILSTLLLGLWFTRRNKTTHHDFKAGGRIPWWVVGISPSNVSLISYTTIPATAFAEDWSVIRLRPLKLPSTVAAVTSGIVSFTLGT